MIRSFIGSIVLALCTSVALPALAQQMPPPEGSPEQSNPYSQPGSGSTTVTASASGTAYASGTVTGIVGGNWTDSEDSSGNWTDPRCP